MLRIGRVPTMAIITFVLVTTIVFKWSVSAAHAGTTHLPDMQAFVPLNEITIATPAPGTRELRYTHRGANLGDGPLEVRPLYDPTTDTAFAFQRIYTHDAAGNWSIVSEVPLAAKFVYHALHGHYHFPFGKYGLYQVAP